MNSRYHDVKMFNTMNELPPQKAPEWELVLRGRQMETSGYFGWRELKVVKEWNYCLLQDKEILPPSDLPEPLETVRKPSRKFLPNLCSNPACPVGYCTKQCGKCRTTFYCSRPCQVAHWKIHKPLCAQEEIMTVSKMGLFWDWETNFAEVKDMLKKGTVHPNNIFIKPYSFTPEKRILQSICLIGCDSSLSCDFRFKFAQLLVEYGANTLGFFSPTHGLFRSLNESEVIPMLELLFAAGVEIPFGLVFDSLETTEGHNELILRWFLPRIKDPFLVMRHVFEPIFVEKENMNQEPDLTNAFDRRTKKRNLERLIQYAQERKSDLIEFMIFYGLFDPTSSVSFYERLICWPQYARPLQNRYTRKKGLLAIVLPLEFLLPELWHLVWILFLANEFP